MPARMLAPSVLRGCRPVRNADMARAWSPPPSPCGRALSQVRPLSTMRSRWYGASWKWEHAGQLEGRAGPFGGPLAHVDAVGHIDDGHAFGKSPAERRPGRQGCSPAPWPPGAAGPRPRPGHATPSAEKSSGCSSFCTPQCLPFLERITLHNRQDQAGKTVVVAFDRVGNVAHGAPVVVFQAAPQGIG